ncbi:type VII secretion system-associated protein [Streptomyces sp. NPDC088354]|uniref:type VII secretion system-associated protein n=1 Tax=Streptomyces sp. NPDC088354 TaxID=3365856 RepID=UPI00381BB64D
MADLTHLDSQKLKAFREGDLAAFITDLKNISADDPNGVLSLHSILSGNIPAAHLGENPILAIGLMAADDTVFGQTLIASTKKSATSINDILAKQEILFRDIDNNLGETITKLLKTQGGSLESISAEDMLDIWSDVDDDLEGSEPPSPSTDSVL